MRHLLPCVLLCLPALALARPAERFAQDVVDDATLSLATVDQAIRGDLRSQCEVRILVVGTAVRFTAGDRVNLWVYEDDLAGDELLWRTDFAITAQELAAQRVDRTLDCSSDFGEDVGGHLEVYAEARIDKDDCGFLCVLDRPTTANIAITEVDDDPAEEDDGRAAARAAALGITPNRVGRDQDWFSVQLPDPSQLTFSALHRPSAGRLEVTLFGPDGAPLGAGVAEADATRLRSDPLAPGQYTVRVQPRDGADFAFYDAELRVDTAACVAGTRQETPCERCGVRVAVCGADGRFGAPSDCQNQGECEAGASQENACGNCGTATERCDATCVWLPGRCENEGPCVPGAEESQACAGGQQVRICGQACTWSDFSVCSPNACADGEQRACYEGPPGTAGIGLCRMGSQRCINGVWASCLGAVMPTDERCDDGDDNDCNGLPDRRDPACVSDAEPGDPCRVDDDCGLTLGCIDPVNHVRFRGGYCGQVGCPPDTCPEGTACAEVDGRRYCLRACEGSGECRSQYTCADGGEGETVCLPRCLRDNECPADAPVCDLQTGLCGADGEPVESPDRGVPFEPRDAGFEEVDAAPLGPVDPRPDVGPTATPTGEASTGCQAGAPGRDMGGWWALLGLALCGRRRRQTI